MTFRMTPSPEQMSDDTINQLVEKGFVADPSMRSPAPANEHPLATFLYRRFKAGSAMLTKLDAYKIGNELDRLLACEIELTRLRLEHAPDEGETPAQRTELVGLGHPEEPPTRLPVPYDYNEPDSWDKGDGL